ncbi:DUF1462 family protein [Pontibacillus salicampi]|uniref:DUF1462 family protein n=1 Tax=Pontibacillus salicampi TaxID=1449801 RepID=A0ABV6LN99_9BACI
MGKAIVTVYGAEQKCASCVNLPSARETYDWLEAAISRKFESTEVQFVYIDIDHPHTEEEHRYYIQRIVDEEYFYPLVVVNGEVVGEGNPRLKSIYAALQDTGLEPVS